MVSFCGVSVCYQRYWLDGLYYLEGVAMTITLTREEAQQVLNMLYDSVSDNREWNKRCEWAAAILRTRLAQPEPTKLWLWKNFVDGKPEYWAFDNPYPTNLEDGDPQTLGQPCGYAIFKPSRDGSNGRTEEQVLREMASVKSKPQLEPKPVAWRTFDGEGGYEYRDYELNEDYGYWWEERHPNHKNWVQPLYVDPTPCQTCEALARTVMMDQTSHDTAPPKREWHGLTDEEIKRVIRVGEYDTMEEFACAIEAKLKEKNT